MLDTSFFAIKPGKKRKSDGAKAVGAKAEAKRVKRHAGVPTPVTISDTLVVIAKSGLAEKAGIVQEEIAKGFVKAALVWDVELVLNDPAKGIDKYYNMQLLASKEGTEFWAVQHWGRTGLAGTVHVDGPFTDLLTAKRVFRKKYRAKTGNIFGQVGSSFLETPGKYKLLCRDARSDETSLWQYFLHNAVDGKVVGWYDYEGESADNMEKYWKQFKGNDGLNIRIIQTMYFKYEVNYSDMIQRNTKTGTRRVIRRVEPGSKPSSEPPAVIPEKVEPEPAKLDEADDDDDDDDDADSEPEDAEDSSEEED